jgi:hypothetical protein
MSQREQPGSSGETSEEAFKGIEYVCLCCKNWEDWNQLDYTQRAYH